MSQVITARTAVLSAAASGDNTLIAANTTRAIKIWQIIGTNAAAVNVIFLAGATALSGTMVFGGAGSINLIYNGMPYFTVPPNNAFIVNLSGAIALGGLVYYTYD